MKWPSSPSFYDKVVQEATTFLTDFTKFAYSINIIFTKLFLFLHTWTRLSLAWPIKGFSKKNDFARE